MKHRIVPRSLLRFMEGSAGVFVAAAVVRLPLAADANPAARPTAPAAAVLAVAPATLAPADPAYPPGPGPLLVPGVNDAAWRARFAALAAAGGVVASFTELRRFAFRPKPVMLQGEMRFDPRRGLSLHYLGPTEAWMIADDRGLLLRDARGRSHEVPNDPRAASAGAALLPILHFDLPVLARTFAIRGAGDEAAWRLDFAARDSGLARTLGAIVVEGTGATVREIELQRSANQRVEIRLAPPRTGVRFADEELRRNFR
jgi:hypothetical protein